MRLSLAGLGFFVTLVCCTSNQREETPPNQLECSPASVRVGEDWTLRMPLPHSMELAILDPDARFFLIAFDEPLAGVEPMIDTPGFRRLDEISIRTTEAQAAYRGSGGRQELIFTKSGRYTALLGVGLRNDHPLIDGHCEVDYQGTAAASKPAP